MTWYRHGLGLPRDAPTCGPRAAPTCRSGARTASCAIDLGEHDVDGIERIEVGWPSAKLESMTLIDTPGLGSAERAARRRARWRRCSMPASRARPRPTPSLYLMRHLHHGDARFLEAFMDHSIAHASPVNAVVVLSRADEIGAARPDALDSAQAIAGALRGGSTRPRARVGRAAGRRTARRDRRDAAPGAVRLDPRGGGARSEATRIDC